jgi:hypothetical protein
MPVDPSLIVPSANGSFSAANRRSLFAPRSISDTRDRLLSDVAEEVEEEPEDTVFGDGMKVYIDDASQCCG